MAFDLAFTGGSDIPERIAEPTAAPRRADPGDRPPGDGAGKYDRAPGPL